MTKQTVLVFHKMLGDFTAYVWRLFHQEISDLKMAFGAASHFTQ